MQKYEQFKDVWNFHTMDNKKKSCVSPFLAYERDAANNMALPFVDGDANDLRFEQIKRGFADMYANDRLYLLTQAEEEMFKSVQGKELSQTYGSPSLR